MTEAILVINAGSSSIKFALFAVSGTELTPVAHGQIEGLGTAPHFIAKNTAGNTIGEQRWSDATGFGHDEALSVMLDWLKSADGARHRVVAVGHRVVHGGVDYQAPVRLDRNVMSALDKLIPLAPLHQPHNLAPIRLLLEREPQLPQVACFDTAFHHTNPQVAQIFAIPHELTVAGVRRYGFHGLSYEYIASVLPAIDQRAANGKCIVLHLGNGVSMCALDARRSIATTMGFTALDGLPMGTRSGSIDPGVILYLQNERKMDIQAVENLIYNNSGLLGVSGISSDMRALLVSTEPRAKLAIALFVYRIGREIGSLAAALGGLDAIVFTAGIGENAAPIRERICRDAAWLGMELDNAANNKGGPRISRPSSRVTAWIIPTDEELMIARHTLTLLRS